MQKLKKANISKLIVAGLIATSVSVYTNLDNQALAWNSHNGVSQEYVDKENAKQDQAIAGGIKHDKEQDQAIEEAKNDRDDIRGEIGQEVADRTEADKNLQDQIDEAKNDRDDIRGEIGQEVADRTEEDNKLQEDINKKEEQSKDRDEQLQNNIDKEEEARQEADNKLQEDINEKEEQSKDRDEQLQNNIDKEITDRTEADNKIHDVIGVQDKNELEQQYDNSHYIGGASSLVDADMKLDQAIYDVNNRVDNLENRVSDVEERIDKVGAMAAAIANLRTMGYDPEAPTEIAIGMGQYKNETGMAVGIFHYPNRDFMLSASLSYSDDEVMGGIGATWKLGRKSAEDRAKDAEEKRLEKVKELEEMAKKEKVKAQAERHAKLLAEREAAGEPIIVENK